MCMLHDARKMFLYYALVKRKCMQSVIVFLYVSQHLCFSQCLVLHSLKVTFVPFFGLCISVFC